MKVKTFNFGMVGTNCYIVYHENTKDAFCVDIADNAPDEYFNFLKNFNVKLMLVTHGHFDHTASILRFKELFDEARVVISKKEYDNIFKYSTPFVDDFLFPKPDIMINDGDEIDFDGKKIKVIFTPGHTSGSVCYLFEDMLFSGDTLFKNSVGRMDFPTGSPEDMRESLIKLKKLPDCKVFPGHMEISNLKTEKEHNPYFKML